MSRRINIVINPIINKRVLRQMLESMKAFLPILIMSRTYNKCKQYLKCDSRVPRCTETRWYCIPEEVAAGVYNRSVIYCHKMK